MKEYLCFKSIHFEIFYAQISDIKQSLFEEKICFSLLFCQQNMVYKF